MKKLQHIILISLFVLNISYSYGQSCTQSASSSGNDCDNFTTTVTISCAPAGAIITGIDITGSIGSYCTSWYDYDIKLDGTWHYSYGDGTNSFSDLNGNVANGTVIYLRAWDNDSYCDWVTLGLTVTVYYSTGCSSPTNEACAGATSISYAQNSSG